ncbi:MAG: hypothetical protein IJ228_08540 [Succinivibrio sp.]|nr:hypothetical protein [Succinivibrio sp.]
MSKSIQDQRDDAAREWEALGLKDNRMFQLLMVNPKIALGVINATGLGWNIQGIIRSESETQLYRTLLSKACRLDMLIQTPRALVQFRDGK